MCSGWYNNWVHSSCRAKYSTTVYIYIVLSGILLDVFIRMSHNKGDFKKEVLSHVSQVPHCKGLYALIPPKIFRHEKSLWSLSKRNNFYFPSCYLRCTLITCLIRVSELMAPNTFQEPHRFLLYKWRTLLMKSNQRFWVILQILSMWTGLTGQIHYYTHDNFKGTQSSNMSEIRQIQIMREWLLGVRH